MLIIVVLIEMSLRKVREMVEYINRIHKYDMSICEL